MFKEMTFNFDTFINPNFKRPSTTEKHSRCYSSTSIYYSLHHVYH